MSEQPRVPAPPADQGPSRSAPNRDEPVRLLNERIETIAEAVVADELAPLLEELKALKERVSKLERGSDEERPLVMSAEGHGRLHARERHGRVKRR